MKKNLIGLSLATLFAASGAVAQTSVTLYGTVDGGVAFQNGAAAAGSVTTLESGQQSYSRVGFRGTEDLGSGMRAIFLLEQGVLIDTGDSGFDTLGSGQLSNSSTFGSQAYVGLASPWGTVAVGRQFSPLYNAYYEIDPFKNGFAANINNFFGSAAINGLSLYQRMSNAITYTTPDNLMGFKGALAYGFGEQAGHTSSDAQIGVSIGYQNGPIDIAYAYHRANNDTLGFAVFQTHFIGATYDFGMAKIHAAFDQSRLNDDSFKNQDYMIGVTVPFGPHALFGDYTHKKDNVVSDANANEFGIGYTYNLSKRTNFYAAYTYVKNNDNSAIDTEVFGNSVNTVQAGIRHMF